MTESVFFQDLAVMMAIAGLAAAVFSRLGWPKVFGYILVGILMNGHTWGGAFLTDTTSIATLAQLGIVFLMLTMGLEFSTSDMKKIKSVTMPTAIIDTVVMVWLGYTLGTRVLGWGTIPSMFLGVAICDSATTLLAKMIGDLGWSNRPFVKYAMGTSVCEDIICVALMALVTGLANGKGLSIGAMAASLGWLFLFFLGTLIFGLVLVPRLLKSIGRRNDDEALLMVLLGIGFFVSWYAFKFNFSLALGAFLVGVVCASSEAKHKLHALVMPLRTMFAAMFFVSIGLLVDPRACWDNVGSIAIVSVAVVFGKLVNCFIGAVLTGQTLKTAVQMAFSLAQIGEFAFMLALVYVGLTGDSLSPMFQVTIGVSLLTTLLNPLMIRVSEPVGEWVEAKCPARLAHWLGTYRSFQAKYRHAEAGDGSRAQVRRAVGELGLIAAIQLAAASGFAVLMQVDWSRFSVWFERYERYAFLILTDVFAIGLFAMIIRVNAVLVSALNDVLVGPGDQHWQAPVRGLVKLFTSVAVFGAFLIEMLMINTAMMPYNPGAWGTLSLVIVVIGLVGWRWFKKIGARARSRFEEALATDRRLADLGSMMTVQVPEGTINRLTLTADSPAVGGTVVTLNIRAKTGASIVSVERDGHSTRNVGPEWEFRIGDTLVALGEPSQIAALKDLLGITT